MPFISKATMFGVKCEIFKKKKSSGNHLDTKFTHIAFCDEKLRVKENVSTKPHFHT